MIFSKQLKLFRMNLENPLLIQVFIDKFENIYQIPVLAYQLLINKLIEVLDAKIKEEFNERNKIYFLMIKKKGY